MKVLQVHLSEEQHKRLRVLAAEKGLAMSEVVRGWVDSDKLVGDLVSNVDLKLGNVVLRNPDLVIKDGYGWCKGCGAFLASEQKIHIRSILPIPLVLLWFIDKSSPASLRQG